MWGVVIRHFWESIKAAIRNAWNDFLEWLDGGPRESEWNDYSVTTAILDVPEYVPGCFENASGHPPISLPESEPKPKRTKLKRTMPKSYSVKLNGGTFYCIETEDKTIKRVWADSKGQYVPRRLWMAYDDDLSEPFAYFLTLSDFRHWAGQFKTLNYPA